jgi:hypothetical protein
MPGFYGMPPSVSFAQQQFAFAPQVSELAFYGALERPSNGRSWTSVDVQPDRLSEHGLVQSARLIFLAVFPARVVQLLRCLDLVLQWI